MEALLRIRWGSFEKWIEDHPDLVIDHPAIVSAVQNIRQSSTLQTFHDLLDMPEFSNLLQLYQQFCQTPEGPMKEFWNSYIEMVMLLLRFIRATREGDWNLHLA